MIEISEKDKKFIEDNLCVNSEVVEEDNYGEKGDINNLTINEVGNSETNHNKINLNTIKANKEEINDPENMKIKTPLTKEDLNVILDNLFSDDLNIVIIIHEYICNKFEQNKEFLISNVDMIITTLILRTDKMFLMKDLNSIPLKFAKY